MKKGIKIFERAGGHRQNNDQNGLLENAYVAWMEKNSHKINVTSEVPVFGGDAVSMAFLIVVFYTLNEGQTIEEVD